MCVGTYGVDKSSKKGSLEERSRVDVVEHSRHVRDRVCGRCLRVNLSITNDQCLMYCVFTRDSLDPRNEMTSLEFPSSTYVPLPFNPHSQGYVVFSFLCLFVCFVCVGLDKVFELDVVRDGTT